MRHQLLLLVVAAVLLPTVARAAEQDSMRLYWHSEGLDVPVLVRRFLTESRVDPVMLVQLSNTSWMTKKLYDPIAKQAFISVPVSLTLNDLGFAFRRLEIKPEFAEVTDVQASVDRGSIYSALGFVWSQGEQTGYLRLGCDITDDKGSGHVCKLDDLVRSLTSGHFAPLRRVLLTARVRILQDASLSPVALDYRLRLVGSGSQHELEDHSVSSRTRQINGEAVLPDCGEKNWLKPWRSVRINRNRCSAMIYQDTQQSPFIPSIIKYLIEEPICYASTAGKAIEILADPSDENRWNLTLRLLMPDSKGHLLAEVAAKLSKPVEQFRWMRLWRVERSVSALLRSRYRVGQLRLPALSATDGRLDGNGELEVHCRHEAACRYLAAKIEANPLNFWRHIRWRATYLAQMPWKSQQCFHTPDGPRFAAVAAGEVPSEGIFVRPGEAEAAAWRRFCSGASARTCSSAVADSRHWIVVQQHRSHSLSFARPWTDYVKGFGDGNNFWIGLTALHLLTTIGHRAGTNLRIEMTYWNGTEGHAEYADFSVAGAEANFSMTYSLMIRERTSVPYDSLVDAKGAGFSTYDRDHDRDAGSCSHSWGRGGWWFGACYRFYPNGLYPPNREQNIEFKYMKCLSDREIVSLSSVRMMIQI